MCTQTEKVVSRCPYFTARTLRERRRFYAHTEFMIAMIFLLKTGNYDRAKFERICRDMRDTGQEHVMVAEFDNLHKTLLRRGETHRKLQEERKRCQDQLAEIMKGLNADPVH